MTLARTILYVEAADVIKDWHLLSVGEQRTRAIWAHAKVYCNEPIIVSGLEIGKCVEVKVRITAEQLGLVIEWNHKLVEVGTLI